MHGNPKENEEKDAQRGDTEHPCHRGDGGFCAVGPVSLDAYPEGKCEGSRAGREGVALLGGDRGGVCGGGVWGAESVCVVCGEED